MPDATQLTDLQIALLRVLSDRAGGHRRRDCRGAPPPATWPPPPSPPSSVGSKNEGL